jgi:hypothetical protein
MSDHATNTQFASTNATTGTVALIGEGVRLVNTAADAALTAAASGSVPDALMAGVEAASNALTGAPELAGLREAVQRETAPLVQRIAELEAVAAGYVQHHAVIGEVVGFLRRAFPHELEALAAQFRG